MRRWLAVLLCCALPTLAAAGCVIERHWRPALAAAEAATASGADDAGTRWRALLASVEGCRVPDARLQLLEAQTNALMRRRETAAALASEAARLQLAGLHGLDAIQADAANRLGIIHGDRGELEPALQRHAEAAEQWRRLERYAQAADAYSRRSRLQRRHGNYLQALRDEQTALRLRRAEVPTPRLWRSLLNIAVLYEQLEQNEEARRRYTEAVADAEASGDPKALATCLVGYAGFLNDRGPGEAAAATALAERALALERELDRPVMIAGALLQLGRAAVNRGQLDAAAPYFREAGTLAEAEGQRALLAHIQLRRGEWALARGRSAEALQDLDAARDTYAAQSNRHRLAKVYRSLEAAHLAAGNPLAAAQAGREHYRLRDALLGGPNTAALSELLREFEVGEERLRSAQLAREKADADLRLQAERRKLQTYTTLALCIAAVLSLMGWRHYTVERLYRVLRERNRVVQAQAEQLRVAHDQLSEHARALYQASITDALTGVANRGHGMQQLAQAAASAASGRPFALLALDIDHFKAINDRYGHPVGDQALIAVAATLRDGLPEQATLARVGGEEFLILLPDHAAEAAHALAELLRQRVAELRLDTERGALTLTVSIGLVEAHPGTSDLSADALYAAADAALYTAKRDGRNRVVRG